MKKCRFCEGFIPQESKYCNHCGRDVDSTAPLGKKPCPNCGSWIAKDAKLCNNCFKDLDAIKDIKSTYRPKLVRGISDLSLDDLYNLAIAWGESYSGNIPNSVHNEIQVVIGRILKEFMPSIQKKHIQKKTLNVGQLSKMIEDVFAQSMSWCYTICAIGIETGYGRISERKMRVFIERVNYPILVYLAGYVDFLWDRKLIKDSEGYRLSELGRNIINQGSMSICAVSMKYHSQWHLKYRDPKMCPFLLELQQIAI